jgi:sulfite reductase beta subunit-like hemoprotein
MSITANNYPKDNKGLVELFKEKYALEGLTEIGLALKQNPSNVGAWISGRAPMPVPIKWRLIDHIGLLPQAEQLVALFVDIREHQLKMEDDRDRIAEIKNQDVYRIINTKEIERIEQFQEELRLTDEQAAKFLEIDLKKFQNIKNGIEEMPTMTKMWFSFLRKLIKTLDWPYKALPEKVGEAFIEWEIENRKQNLQKRIDKKSRM